MIHEGFTIVEINFFVAMVIVHIGRLFLAHCIPHSGSEGWSQCFSVHCKPERLVSSVTELVQDNTHNNDDNDG